MRWEECQNLDSSCIQFARYNVKRKVLEITFY
jgi:hypothetical protein